MYCGMNQTTRYDPISSIKYGHNHSGKDSKYSLNQLGDLTGNNTSYLPGNKISSKNYSAMGNVANKYGINPFANLYKKSTLGGQTGNYGGISEFPQYIALGKSNSKNLNHGAIYI